MDETFNEIYINLRKNKQCFKSLLDSKQSNSNIFSTFVCPNAHETFMVLNNIDDIEIELIKLCDKKCNIKSKNLNL